MPTKSTYEKYASAIFSAQEDVAKAMAEQSKGGRVDAVNRANARLAKAHCRYAEAQGQNVPDDRY